VKIFRTKHLIKITMKNSKNFLLDVGISNLSKQEILEEIKKWLKEKTGFYQIFTINPEILVLAQKNKRFKELINKAQIAPPDGIGIVLAAQILGQPLKERVAGVKLMEEMVKMASDLSLTIGMIGGRDNVALKAAECLKKTYPSFKFFALDGIRDVKKVTDDEWVKIISIIHANKPQMLFVAFGALWQEFFIDALKKELQVTSYKLDTLVAMSVGGSFDEISGQIKRVPEWFDKLGFKWLWRLIQEPWRWKRQLALIEFVFLVFKERLMSFFKKDSRV